MLQWKLHPDVAIMIGLLGIVAVVRFGPPLVQSARDAVADFATISRAEAASGAPSEQPTVPGLERSEQVVQPRNPPPAARAATEIGLEPPRYVIVRTTCPTTRVPAGCH